MRRRTKFLLLRTSIVALFVILAGRLWYVQVVNSAYYKAQADTSKIRLESVDAPRGIIYDRNGQQLVYNAPIWNVMIVPHGVPSAAAASIYHTLSRLMGGTPTPPEIRRMVDRARWRPYTPTLIKHDVSPDTGMVIKQLHRQLPGVRAETTSTRQYVGGPLLAHVLGYTGKIGPQDYATDRRLYPVERFGENDQVGQTGIEAVFDQYLHGVNGQARVEVDAGERPIRTLKPGAAVPGDSVYLTIDWKLQQQVAADLAAGLQKGGWSRGIAILEDIHTGQIVSMVSLPSFDNNWFSRGISQKRYDSLLNAPGHPLNDQAAAGEFPPGSTFKVITAAAALQNNIVSGDTVINDTGLINLGPNAVFHGWQPPPGLGPVNVVGALMKSSDIYFYTVAGGDPTSTFPSKGLGPDRLATYSRLFGLGALTNIELSTERPGLVPTSAWHRARYGQPWYIGDSYNTGIGQGDNLVTPLQMVSVAATIANGGIYYRPRIIQRIVGSVQPRQRVLKYQRVIEPFVPSIVRRDFVSPANIALIQQGMHLSVSPLSEHGTSFNVVDPRVDAAGKTGTAEARGGAHGWWIGYAPYNNPQVAISVLVPNAASEGAYSAAPIARKLLQDYFSLKPLTPNWLSDVQVFEVPSGGGSQ